jgi:hypothetical protein
MRATSFSRPGGVEKKGQELEPDALLVIFLKGVFDF